MAGLVIEIGGSLPYNQRLKILDLLSWRVIERIEQDGHLMVDQQLISPELLQQMRSAHGNARRLFEPERVRFDFPFDEFDFLRRGFRRPGDDDRSKYERVYFPVVPHLNFDFMERIIENERLALSGASLALAAAEIEPFDILELRSINPLKLHVNLPTAAAVIGVVTVVTGG